MDWITSANNKTYDYANAFNKLGVVYWHQGKFNFSVGDILYLYCTKPFMKVMYKTYVTETDLSFNDIIDDKDFWLDKQKYEKSKTYRFLKLKLISQIDKHELHFHKLRENGLNGSPQGAFKVSPQLKNYMDTYFDISLSDETFPDSDNIDKYFEGAKITVTVNKYERDIRAREKCITYHGCYCHVCGINFEEVYGEIGNNFIHVHHIVPLNEINEEYIVNPKTDLIPVCPNCHAILHRKLNGKYISVAELKTILAK